MKKVLFFLFIFFLWTNILCVCFANDEPVYNPEYDSGGGAFYANGTSITIDTDINQNTVITWDGGSQIVPPTVVIFGGGTAGSFYNSSNIVMNGGTVLSIFGGGVSTEEGLPAIVETSNITINDGNITQNVIGGGVLYAEVNEANITVNNGTMAAVVGGGMASAVVDGVYYSVGTEESPQTSPNRTNNINIAINGGTINSETLNYGLVYGGGQGYSFAGKINLVINQGDLSQAYVTAGGSNGYTDTSNVEINGGNIYIYQGVNRGTIESVDTRVTGGTIQNFYIGGETGDSTVTGTLNQAQTALLDGVIVSLNAGKSNSQPIVTDENNYVLIKTDDVEIQNDNISSEEIEILYEISTNTPKIIVNKGEAKPINVVITTIPAGYERLFGTIEYQSNNEEIATVSESGVVTGVNDGQTTINVSLLEEEINVDVIVESEFEVLWIFIVILLALLILLLIIW